MVSGKAFFADVIAERRASPGDSDLVSFLLAARLDDQPLTDEHINGTLRLLLLAGVDTTWSALGSCLWHLARHAEDRHRLAVEPNLIPRAVEEFLRVYAPVTMGREIVKETEIAGCRFKEGEMVMLAYPAANRDPAMFADPDRVDFDRTENQNRQVAFGLGIHRCIGAHLARLELTIALEEWLRCIRDFVLIPGAEVEWSAGSVRGPRSLPFRLASCESKDARALTADLPGEAGD
jgi:cytochrome P450